MDDIFLMCCVEGATHTDRDIEDEFWGQGATVVEEALEADAFEPFHNQVRLVLEVSVVEDANGGRMAHARGEFGFALKSGACFEHSGFVAFFEDFDGDKAVDALLSGFPNGSPRTCTDGLDELISVVDLGARAPWVFVRYMEWFVCDRWEGLGSGDGAGVWLARDFDGAGFDGLLQCF